MVFPFLGLASSFYYKFVLHLISSLKGIRHETRDNPHRVSVIPLIVSYVWHLKKQDIKKERLNLLFLLFLFRRSDFSPFLFIFSGLDF